MRIRTIKPEFWASEDMARCSDAAQLLAIGLLNYADDEGYFNANPMLIKAALFPLRSEGSVSIHAWLSELSNVGYIEMSEGVDGRNYGRVVHFDRHQRINRPTPSSIKGLWQLTEGSVRPPGGLSEASPLERKGKEQGTGNREARARGHYEIVHAEFLHSDMTLSEVVGWVQCCHDAFRSVPVAAIENALRNGGVGLTLTAAQAESLTAMARHYAGVDMRKPCGHIENYLAGKPTRAGERKRLKTGLA